MSKSKPLKSNYEYADMKNRHQFHHAWLGPFILGGIVASAIWILAPAFQYSNGTQGFRDAALVANIFDELSENQRFFDGSEVVFDYTRFSDKKFESFVERTRNIQKGTIIGEFALFKLPDDQELCGLGYFRNGGNEPYLLLQSRESGITTTIQLSRALSSLAASDTARYSIIRRLN